MVRRSLAGGLLIVLGLLLFGSQSGGDTGRVVFGLALLLAWGCAGVGVLSGRWWGRVAGLALAGVGIVGGLFQLGQSSPGGDRVLLDLFFLAGGPNFAWINVGLASAGFATLSAGAGILLLLPFSPSAHGQEGLGS